MRSGYAPVNGIDMYYEIHGQGHIPLVLMHGGGSTIQTTFGRMLPALAADACVIAMELQAHGRTSDRDAPESFEQDAADVAALLQYLQIEKANILGFSNGGTAAIRLAERFPQRVNKLIAISANYQREGLPAGFFEAMQQITIADMPAFLKADFLAVMPDEKKLQNMFEKDRLRMVTFTDIPDSVLAAISAPTLLIVGDRDVISVAHVLKMSTLIPDARLAVLPADHGSLIGETGSHDNKSAYTVQLVKDFLAA